MLQKLDKMKLLILGGTAFDYLCKVKDVNTKVTQVLEYNENLGGMAYNTAVACAQLGTPTKLISPVGPDFPKLKKVKNLTPELHYTKTPTTRSFLFFDGSDERICFYRGPYHDMNIKKAKTAIKGADWVHFAGVAPCFAELAKFASKNADTVSLNGGYDLFHYPPSDPLIQTLLDSSDYTVSSEKEVEYLKRNPRELAKTATVITRGKLGSEIFTENSLVSIPPYGVKVSSPFGAGDTYTGTFISAMLMGKNLTESARLASAAGSFAVEEKTTTPKLSWAKISKRANNLP